MALSQELVDFYCQRAGTLRTDRGNFNSQWEEAAMRIAPAQVNTFIGEPGTQVQGQKKTENQFDSTAAFSCSRFASVIESLVTPQGSVWHLLRAVDPALRKNRAVRRYYDQVSEILMAYRYRPKANFVGNSQQVYHSLGMVGNGVMFIDRPDNNRGLRYKNIHLGEAYFQQNHAGVVDTMYRTFALEPRQIVKMFPDTVPETVVAKAKLPTNTEKMKILHVVHPRDDYLPGYFGSQGLPFASCYILKDEKKALREGGFYTFPFAVTRYTQANDETYGRGPAQFVLPAIKVLDQEKKTYLKIGHRMSDPVLLAHDTGNIGSFQLRSGKLNPGTLTKDGKRLVDVLPTGNFTVNEKMMEMERETIKDAFLITLFQILVDTPQMTATEVLERTREKGMLLAPTGGRIEAEFLGSLIEREIDLLSQQGLLPPMPSILAEAQAEYRVEYDSPMSRMRRMERATGFMRSLDIASNYTKLTGDPRPLDWFAFDRAMPEIQDISGAPTDWTSTPEEVTAIRAQRTQQQQIQNITDVAPALASVAKSAPSQG